MKIKGNKSHWFWWRYAWVQMFDALVMISTFGYCGIDRTAWEMKALGIEQGRDHDPE